MKLALISDIHGNYKALEAFLEYLETQNADGILCLGDYLTDSPYPQRTLSLLYDMKKKYPCIMIRGNREQYLIDNFYHPQGFRPSSANGSLYYTALHVTEADIHFMEQLPMTEKVNMEDCPSMLLCHATPDALRGNVREEPCLKEKALRELEQDYLFGGHSHHQEVDSMFGKIYVNPGSLGMAVDGRGKRAEFAMLQSEKNGQGMTFRIERCSIPYDVNGFLQDFTACGLDEYGMILNRAIKKTLVTGVNYFIKAVVEATRISGMPLQDIPEQVWQQVADKLEL